MACRVCGLLDVIHVYDVQPRACHVSRPAYRRECRAYMCQTERHGIQEFGPLGSCPMRVSDHEQGISARFS